MIRIMRGDSFHLLLDLYQGDTRLREELVEDVEICIGSRRQRRTLKGGGLVWDREADCFRLYLSQEDTYALESDAVVVARVKYPGAKEFDVRGCTLGRLNISDTYSREVL